MKNLEQFYSIEDYLDANFDSNNFRKPYGVGEIELDVFTENSDYGTSAEIDGVTYYKVKVELSEIDGYDYNAGDEAFTVFYNTNGELEIL